MATRLSSEAKTILTKMEKLQEKAEALEAQVEKWKEEAGKAKLFIGVVDYLTTVDKFAEAAAAEEVSLQDWAVEKLIAACEPEHALPIDHGMYQRFKELAVSKSVSLSELTMGEEFTAVLLGIFENRRM